MQSLRASSLLLLLGDTDTIIQTTRELEAIKNEHWKKWSELAWVTLNGWREIPPQWKATAPMVTAPTHSTP